MATAPSAAIFGVLAEEAAGESSLWADALLPRDERKLVPVFSVLCEPRFAVGVETIYEGYLLHFGSPRLFAPADADTALLLGDYLYAHGLVRIAATGSVDAVNDLAELISLCAQAQADGTAGDWAAWAATAASLGAGTLDAARARLRQFRDPTALEQVAWAAAGQDAVERARLAHDLCVG